MRMHPILALAVGLTLAACEDNGGPSTDGRLLVSTSTRGGDPDQDGYRLAVDGADLLTLDPIGDAEIGLPSGKHTLTLFGAAEHCSVAPETSLEVDVPPQGTASVAFDVSCPATAARITTTTTGLDIDPNGYRVVVSGIDRGGIPSNGTAVTRLDPGSHAIALTGLTSNCRTDGPASRTVNFVDPEIVPIEFAVVCTATSGVVEFTVQASGTDVEGEWWATLDGGRILRVGPGGPHYLTPVPAGDHVVSLVGPPNCSVKTDPQSVTVTVGKVIRDTVEVAFSATCAPQSIAVTVRVTAPTTGSIPSSTRYEVWYESFGYWDYGGTSTFLGVLALNDALVADLAPSEALHYWYRFELKGVPANCSVQDPHPYPAPGFTITRGDRLDVEFAVACSP